MELPYIAGFFDGEGCICFNRRQARPTHNPCYSLRIHLTQKKRAILDEIVAFLGCGKVYVYEGNCACIHWNCKQAEAVLRKLLPYLKCKHEEAEIALVAQGAKSTHRGWAYHALRFIKNPDSVTARPTTPMKTMKMSPPPTRHPLIQEFAACGPNHS